MASQYPLLVMIFCGELYFIVLKQAQILKVCKVESQRTKKENKQIEQGLRRSLLLEAIIFAPVSIILFRYAILPLLFPTLIQLNPHTNLWYGLMGIAGYNFPFVLSRKIITIKTFTAIQSFAAFINSIKVNGQ